MANWTDAVLFGFALVAFVLGLSSIIMGMLQQPSTGNSMMKEKVEYGFFGVTALVICAVFIYAL